ncbi:hypothetical protein RND71_005467 [Anisodus tanguticus]|uniref:TF-B3 domain-containing protein n=1 Tax=Anisodus tanguticus TaxID=243964 RepID=A0AAE1SRJ7_9SOLA|nr:hypothetical protein RND71_005467 [Anisodus tanguticus]
MNAQLTRCRNGRRKRRFRKQNSTSTSTSGEMYFPQENTKGSIVFCKLLCETDVGNSCSVLIGKKEAEDHLPCLAPGKSKILEFQDFYANNFRMEFMHSNFGEYYLRTGWERYRTEHKLKYMDLLTVYKKEKQNGFDDQQYFYVIECQKLPPDTFQDDTNLYVNPNGLPLPKKEVEENLNDVLLPEIGGKVTLSLFDPIEERVFEMKLVHSEEEEYYLGGKGWKEYVAKHNLLIFDTIFVSKVTVNHDEANPSSAECIWEKVIDRNSELDDQLVNNSYYYQITYRLRGTKPQKKSKQLGKTTENSSAPASTTTAVNNSSTPDSTTTTGKNNSKGKGVAIPDYDSDDVYWLSYDN